jgi:hypothetical protein
MRTRLKLGAIVLELAALALFLNSAATAQAGPLIHSDADTALSPIEESAPNTGPTDTEAIAFSLLSLGGTVLVGWRCCRSGE